MLTCLASQVLAGTKATQTYDELVASIRQTRQESKSRLQEAARLENIREAWEIGKLIDEHVLQHKERAEYAKHVMLKLAKDLGMSERELYSMLEFVRAYPNLPHATKLSWSEYRDLLSVNDEKIRKELEEKASRENWSRERLREEIRKIKSGAGPGNPVVPVTPLAAEPGKVGAYKIIRAKTGPFAGQLMLDLGFSNYVSLRVLFPKLTPQETAGNPGGRRGADENNAFEKFKEKDIVMVEDAALSFPHALGGNQESEKTMDPRVKNSGLPAGQAGMTQKDGIVEKPVDDAAIYGQQLNLLPQATEADLFTYKAYPFQIQDGDTFTAVIDLGFGFATVQTLRLRGIDAPELMSAEGEAAKKALEQLLMSFPHALIGDGTNHSNDIPPVLIRTVKSDKYDRYLADVFVDGKYVNQELVAAAHAVVVEE